MLAEMPQQCVVPGESSAALVALPLGASQMHLRHMFAHAFEVHLVATAACAPTAAPPRPCLPIVAEVMGSQMPCYPSWGDVVQCYPAGAALPFAISVGSWGDV